MFAQKLLSAFAVLSVAAAQTSSICSQATATINSPADASQYAACSTIDGDVVVSPDASGIIQLDGPEQITGNLICHNAGGLTQLSSASINSIGKAFDLFNLTLLSTLQFNQLESATTITWDSLPALSALTFPAYVSKSDSVTITNTFLSSLDGINLMKVGTLNINNNNRLLKFSTQVANVSDTLIIANNGESLDLSFPNLIWAANMTLRNISSLSIPSLSVINGSLGFYENYFTSINAPNLTTVGDKATSLGSLAFVANPSLANISMPLLDQVAGAYQIANNSDLGGISFPALAYVGGAIEFSGDFSTPLLPSLNLVKGAFNITSTSPIDCSTFNSEKGTVLRGTYNCESTSKDSGAKGSGTSTSSSPSSTSSKKGGAASYGISEVAAGLGVVGGFMQMLL